MNANVRRMRLVDLWRVVSIGRHAFPEDPWTTATARGLVARSWLGRDPTAAAWLARLIRLTWVNEAMTALRLACLLVLRRPANLTYVVAEEASVVVGYAALMTVDETGEIHTVAVRADHQGRGIATVMLQELISDMAARGMGGAVLYTRADNARARQLYLRTGFRETGVLPGYYQPSGTDAIVMQLPIGRQTSSRPESQWASK
jgi:ribosomal-protein-alanine N-acetyltransferase